MQGKRKKKLCKNKNGNPESMLQYYEKITNDIEKKLKHTIYLYGGFSM